MVLRYVCCCFEYRPWKSGYADNRYEKVLGISIDGLTGLSTTCNVGNLERGIIATAIHSLHCWLAGPSACLAGPYDVSCSPCQAYMFFAWCCTFVPGKVEVSATRYEKMWRKSRTADPSTVCSQGNAGRSVSRQPPVPLVACNSPPIHSVKGGTPCTVFFSFIHVFVHYEIIYFILTQTNPFRNFHFSVLFKRTSK